MSCECHSKQLGHEYDCKCGYAAELSKLATYGRLVCRCDHPIDIAVQNGKGPVSSTDCALCGKQLRNQKRPWRHLVPEYATDRDVEAARPMKFRCQTQLGQPKRRPSSRKRSRR
jgi:hypothetical protein